MSLTPLSQIAAQLRDGAIVKGRQLKLVLKALQRAFPIAGEGIRLQEYPDGTLIASTVTEIVSRHPFFCEVTGTATTNWLVTVDPGQVRAVQNSVNFVPTIGGTSLTNDPPPTLSIPQSETITYGIFIQVNYSPTFLEGWTTGVFDFDSGVISYANMASFPVDTSGAAYILLAELAPGGVITNLVQTNLSILVDDDGSATETAVMHVFFGPP